MDRESLLEQTREVFRDARDALRAALEDEIEIETRAVYPTAADLSVEVYNDKSGFGEPRGRLIDINPYEDLTKKQRGAIAERTAHLLDEWATTANADSTEIVFRPLPE